MLTCRKCRQPYEPTGIIANQFGYCSEQCRRTKMLYTKTCQLASCGVTFQTSHEKGRFCCQAHKDAFYNDRRRGTAACRQVVSDLPDARIDAILDALARRRRQTRSWLRIEDPWAQRPGAALHERHQWAGVE